MGKEFDNLDTENKPVVNNEEGTEEEIMMKKDNDIRGISDATESTAVIRNAPDNLNFNEDHTSNSTSEESISDDVIDDTVTDVDKLSKLVRGIVNNDLATKISGLDYIEPSQCNVYLSHIMCQIYEENPDNINDRFSGRLDASFISNRSSDNIVSINVSNFIKCYTKSNTVKNYHISYEVLIWCYLDEYDIDSLIKFIFDNTTRRVISEFNFNELDDTTWCLPTTMRHIKKIANKYSGLIKYSNTKFSNGASEMSTINMTFNLGDDMNTAVSEFNNEFSHLDDEDDDEDYLDDEDDLDYDDEDEEEE